MEPNYYTGTTPDTPNTQSKRILQLAVLLVVVLAAYFGYLFYQSTQFRVVSTDPPMGNFAAIAPYVDFNFNKPLASSSVSVSSQPNFTSSYKVTDKTLRVTIPNNLTVGQKYTLTIKSISSTDGKQLVNKSFTFTAKNIDIGNLSEAMRQAILSIQSQQPVTKDSYAYVGSDDLINDGLSQDQLGDLQQALFQYLQKTKQTTDVKTINITDIVQPQPHPEKPLAPDFMNFTVSFDNGKTFHGKLQLVDLSTARLYLSDKNGKQAYDSKNINVHQTTN